MVWLWRHNHIVKFPLTKLRMKSSMLWPCYKFATNCPVMPDLLLLSLILKEVEIVPLQQCAMWIGFEFHLMLWFAIPFTIYIALYKYLKNYYQLLPTFKKAINLDWYNILMKTQSKDVFGHNFVLLCDIVRFATSNFCLY